jgi:hypothetical protein
MKEKQTVLPLKGEKLEERIASAFLRARLRYNGDIRKFYQHALEKDPSTRPPADDRLQDLQSLASGRERKLRPA